MCWQGIVLAVVLAGMCDILSLEDKTARSLGVNVNLMRILISLVAVLLAAISAAVAGSISFLGLIVPHMGRILVGSEHKKLLPFSMLLGAFCFFWQILQGGPSQRLMKFQHRF